MKVGVRSIKSVFCLELKAKPLKIIHNCPEISCCVVAGVLEVVTGIPVGTTLVLDSPMFPEHLDYVELIHTPGETSATIRTKKPLDVKIFHEVNELTKHLTTTKVQNYEFKSHVVLALFSTQTINSLCLCLSEQ